ncbi:YtxH domain-containing protein [soil metagenome]
MANSGNSLLALITGAAIGAAIGLLYAPDSGENTREKLSREAQDAKDQFNKKYQETSSNLSSRAKKARIDFEHRLEETLSSASYKADEILAAMESKLEDLRKQNAKLQKDDKTDITDSFSGRNSSTNTPNKAVV